MRPDNLFSQSRFADEVSDWLQNRATSTEAERFQRYIGLIGQTAAGQASTSSATPSHFNSSKPRPASTLGFSTRKNPQQVPAASQTGATCNRPATASPNSSSWLHTSTKAAAGRLTAPTATVPADGLTGQTIKQCSLPSAAAAAGAQQAASQSRSKSAGTPPSASCGTPKCVNVTTAQAYHGLKELYPDLWANTVPICRPDAAPNKNFISEWGESLRQGAAEAWAPYLASTYQVANLQVAKPTDEFAVRADEALISWSAKQKLYYGDVLTPQAAAAVEKLLDGKQQLAEASGTAAGETGAAAGLSVADRKGLVETLRQVNAVVLPDSTKSMCHTLHKPQYSVENTETTAIMKEQTRIKTMGFPRKVEVKGFAHNAPKASTSSSRAASAGPLGSSSTTAGGVAKPGSSGIGVNSKGPGRITRGPKASEMIDTFSSKVPLKWAASAVGAPTSSYTSSYGGNPGHAPQMCKTIFKEVNVGFGHVDQHQYPTSSAIYPVEQLYLQQSVVPGQEQKEADLKTTQRMSYKPRDPEDVARSIVAAREQIEASQVARNKSFIPLSKAGIQLGSSAQWRSSYGADFIPRKADLSANRAMASAVAGMFNGPTIAFGKIAGMRAGDVAKIAKHKAEQEAAAAARAQAEAELDKRVAAGH